MSEPIKTATPSPFNRFKLYPEYKDSGLEWLEEIPVHWEAKRLKRLFKVVNGSTPRSEEPSYWDGDIPWVTPDDLGELTSRELLEPRRYITEDGYRSCGTSMVPSGSLVLSTRAPIGHLAIAEVNLCTNQGCRSLVFRKDHNRYFFYYLLFAAHSELESWGQGSTFKELAKSKLEYISLVDLPLHEQLAIVSFLDRETAKIDTLISKRERLIELLQEKRTALINQAVTKGLDPNVPLKDSGIDWLGEIPIHWEVCHLRRVVLKFVDYRGKTPDKVPIGIPLITAKNIKNQQIDFSLSEEFIGENEYDAWMVRGLPEVGDVLITTEAPLGESAQIVDPNIALAQRIILLKANKQRIINDYLKYHFACDSGKSELLIKATGSTALGIKASHLKETLITVPSIDEQEAIVEYIKRQTSSIDMLMAKIREAIDHLKEYRTALISTAVTGKIDVRGETT
jgi:type I restriction enzyme S subunit